MTAVTLRSRLRMAATEVQVDQGADGVIRLRSPQVLAPQVPATGHWLEHWASEAPSRVFLAQRNAQGDWREVRYGEALAQVRQLAQGLLDAGACSSRPLAILSGNSIDHALLTQAALHVGIPVVPVSVAYSLVDPSFGKLRHIINKTQPGVVFAEEPDRFAKALEAIGRKCTSLDALRKPATEAVDRHLAQVGPETVAKILFTSGSTGFPKGVINTQRMLTVNQQQSAQVWRFLTEQPPVMVDWLPWNHTFGGNYNFNLVLSNGGTLYIDGGKPLPGQFDESLRTLREVAPTLYCNVPRAFDMLLPHLESDAQFRRHFFSRCSFIFYAGAALPATSWERLERLAQQERDGDLALVSSWGSTETAPMCAGAHGATSRAGVIGLPVPGCEIKLVPNGSKLEARVRGPNITPGYHADEELTREAFDDEGFYCIGDALKFVDPQDPTKGLAFDGRVAEDFKLRTGTWVHVGQLRLNLLEAAAPLVQDAVITGHDRDAAGALLFLNAAAIRELAPQEVQGRLARAMGRLNAGSGGGSSTQVTRALVLVDPPRVDLGEITDKGYINQRAVLENRRGEVERLYGSVCEGLILPA